MRLIRTLNAKSCISGDSVLFFLSLFFFFMELFKYIALAFFTSQAQNVFDPSKDSHEVLEEFLSESWIALAE